MDIFDIDYDECIKGTLYDYKKIDDERLLSSHTVYSEKKYIKEMHNNTMASKPEFWLRNQGRSGEERNGRSSNVMFARQTVDIKGAPYDLFEYSSKNDNTTTTNPKLGFRPCLWVTIE